MVGVAEGVGLGAGTADMSSSTAVSKSATTRMSLPSVHGIRDLSFDGTLVADGDHPNRFVVLQEHPGPGGARDRSHARVRRILPSWWPNRCGANGWRSWIEIRSAMRTRMVRQETSGEDGGDGRGPRRGAWADGRFSMPPQQVFGKSGSIGTSGRRIRGFQDVEHTPHRATSQRWPASFEGWLAQWETIASDWGRPWSR